MRLSVSNFTYNHIGHFEVSAEVVYKALFLGGVTLRFPTLKIAFQQSGVGWACNLYADLVGHWKKRNARALAEVDPANLDRKRLADLFDRYANPAWAGEVTQCSLKEEGRLPAIPWTERYDSRRAESSGRKISASSSRISTSAAKRTIR